MESEQGWNIPLVKLKDGKKTYYRYSDKSFSIRGQGINQSEAEQIKETLYILSSFKGLPNFGWIEEMKVRLQDTFKLNTDENQIVSFEENPYLKGLNHFSVLFNAIQKSIALKITYQGYKETEANQFILHPWHLKQYNNRWFLLGFNEQYNGLSNLALDRIITIKETHIPYKKNENIDFEDFFYDIVGVSVNPKLETQKVLLKVDHSLWKYIESKPIHGSQKVKSKDEDGVTIELTVQVNYELKSLLFSYMSGIEILAPQDLRQSFKEIINTIQTKYN
jgi:predicted DNA-binding transcriptional regulator YafY